jgi:hypothetical protein
MQVFDKYPKSVLFTDVFALLTALSSAFLLYGSITSPPNDDGYTGPYVVWVALTLLSFLASVLLWIPFAIYVHWKKKFYILHVWIGIGVALVLFVSMLFIAATIYDSRPHDWHPPSFPNCKDTSSHDAASAACPVPQ